MPKPKPGAADDRGESATTGGGKIDDRGRYLVLDPRKKSWVHKMASSEFGESRPGQRTERKVVMQDAIFLAVTILFFVISLAYVHFCERVR